MPCRTSSGTAWRRPPWTTCPTPTRTPTAASILNRPSGAALRTGQAAHPGLRRMVRRRAGHHHGSNAGGSADRDVVTAEYAARMPASSRAPDYSSFPAATVITSASWRPVPGTSGRCMPQSRSCCGSSTTESCCRGATESKRTTAAPPAVVRFAALLAAFSRLQKDSFDERFGIRPGNRIMCEPCHRPVAQLMICGGRVLPVGTAGAVGANPPQESLRPTYRRGKATLESSPGNRAHRRCKRSLQQQARGNSQVQYRAGRNPNHCGVPAPPELWSSSMTVQSASTVLRRPAYRRPPPGRHRHHAQGRRLRHRRWPR